MLEAHLTVTAGPDVGLLGVLWVIYPGYLR